MEGKINEVPDNFNPRLETVIFLPADKAGCGYIRCDVPARSMQRMGIANTIVIDPKATEVPAGKYIVLQRNVSAEKLKILTGMRENYGSLFVVEEDDNFTALPYNNPAFNEFHRYAFKNAACGIKQMMDEGKDVDEWISKFGGEKEAFFKALKDKVKDYDTMQETWDNTARNNFHEVHRHTVGNADLVTVTTEHLREVYSKINPNVIILPNCIDLQEPAYSVNRIDHKGVVIGWAGSLTHLGDFVSCAPALKQIFYEYPEVRIMIGAEFRIFENILNDLPGVPEFLKKIEDYFKDGEIMSSKVANSSEEEVESDCGRFIYRKGTSPEKYPKMWRDVDIALVPGRINMSFYWAKSDLKGLEAAGQHVPIIASPTPEYVKWRSGQTGCFLVKKNRHRYWYKFMKLLISDKGLRREMSAQSYEFAKTREIDAWSAEWMKSYRNAYNSLAYMEKTA